MEDFVHDFYSIDKYKKTFAYAINLINGRKVWVKQDLPTFLPPYFDVNEKFGFLRGGLRKVNITSKNLVVPKNYQRKATRRLAQNVELLNTQRKPVTNTLQCSILWGRDDSWWLLLLSFIYMLVEVTLVIYNCIFMQPEVNQMASDSCHPLSQPSTFI